MAMDTRESLVTYAYMNNEVLDPHIFTVATLMYVLIVEISGSRYTV